MALVQVEKDIPAPVSKVWAVLSDFGNFDWIPGLGDAGRTEGSGIGMFRIFPGPDGDIREQLKSLDPDNHTVVYTIPVGIPFPVEDYEAKMVVTETAGGSHVAWTCEAKPVGVSAEEAGAGIQGAYTMMLDGLAQYVAG